jgi:hypothetical protein
MLAIAVVAAAVPSWVWATLVMSLFVIVSVAAMLLVRYPLRDLPPSADDVKPPGETRNS